MKSDFPVLLVNRMELSHSQNKRKQEPGAALGVGEGLDEGGMHGNMVCW